MDSIYFADPMGLAPGSTDTGKITVTAGEQSVSADVSITVGEAGRPKVRLSRSGMAFFVVQGGGINKLLSQNFGVLSEGSGRLNWQVTRKPTWLDVDREFGFTDSDSLQIPRSVRRAY